MSRRAPLLVLALIAAATLSACGSQSIELAADDPDRQGAQLFVEKCAGCHTFTKVGSEGSSTKISDKERVDGPNFDTRKEEVDQVLYAIRNGGFSGAIMPENLLVGAEADAVAKFLAKYSGKDADRPKSPGQGEEPPSAAEAAEAP